MTLFLLSSLVFSSLVQSHAILTAPKGRSSGTQMSTFANPEAVKVNTFPPTPEQLNSCLDSTPQTSTLTVSPGGQTTVEWEIKAKHGSDPGVRVALLDPRGGPAMVLVDNVNVNALKTTVAFPAGLSPGPAVLQWMWVTKEDNGFYLGCADITVAGGASPPAQQQQLVTPPTAQQQQAVTPPAAQQQQVVTPPPVQQPPPKNDFSLCGGAPAPVQLAASPSQPVAQQENSSNTTTSSGKQLLFPSELGDSKFKFPAIFAEGSSIKVEGSPSTFGNVGQACESIAVDLKSKSAAEGVFEIKKSLSSPICNCLATQRQAGTLAEFDPLTQASQVLQPTDSPSPANPFFPAFEIKNACYREPFFFVNDGKVSHFFNSGQLCGNMCSTVSSQAGGFSKEACEKACLSKVG